MRSPLFFVVLAALAVAPRTEAATDFDRIKEKGVLRTLVVEGSPAFLSVAPGAAPGLEREILEGFGRLHGLKIELVEVPTWEELVPFILAGKGDIIAGGVNDTPARRAHIDFTAEVFPTRDVVLTRKPNLPILTLEELRAVKVGTIKGTTLAERVAEAKIPKSKVDDTLPATGFADALRSGRVVAVVDGVEDALLLQKADPSLQLGMFLGPPGSMAFGVRKDAPALRDALSQYIGNVRKTATWGRLVVKYFGTSAADVLKKARGE
jgi:membrane-bound lytic murein transglycosylase F